MTALIPPQYRLAVEFALTAVFIAACVALGAIGMHWYMAAKIANIEAAWSKERAALAQAVADQLQRNIELQQAAEKHYVVQAQVRDRYVTKIQKEIVHDAAPLATCPVPEPLRVRLNALRDCALSDSPAACGGDGVLPAAGPDPGHGGQK